MMRLKMKYLSAAILSLIVSGSCLSQGQSEDNNIVVVANINDLEMRLSKQQVKSLFMGSSLGYDFVVVSLPPSSLVRVNFNTQVIGLTEDRIQSFWAQMRFTGRKTQPKQIASVESLLEYLISTPGAVAYLPASTALPANLKVLYKTGD
jgi:hypothetical protein